MIEDLATKNHDMLALVSVERYDQPLAFAQAAALTRIADALEAILKLAAVRGPE